MARPSLHVDISYGLSMIHGVVKTQSVDLASHRLDLVNHYRRYLGACRSGGESLALAARLFEREERKFEDANTNPLPPMNIDCDPLYEALCRGSSLP